MGKKETKVPFYKAYAGKPAQKKQY